MRTPSNKVLITGSNGLLGQKLVGHCINNNIDFLATANESNKFSKCPDDCFSILDITNSDLVKTLINKYQPTHIINAAAMTNVDACEDNIDNCYAVNYEGVKNLLNVIKYSPINIIQISTDFVFDGQKKIYNEEDATHPLSEYGKSKWMAEKLLIESNYNNITILRTSILYGTGELLKKSNIFNWAMAQLREGKELKIVNDQFRTPTFVDDLVQACFKVIELDAKGIYNIAGGDLRSMYDYILILAEYVGASKDLVHPISSGELNQKAIRPRSSGLNIDKAKHQISYKPTDFMQTLFKIDPTI